MSRFSILMRTLLKLFYIASYYLFINRVFYFLNSKRQRVITYHNILPDKLYDATLPHCGVSHAESTFERQIELLVEKFPITLEIGKPGTCIVTFDDGYENNFSCAHKILSKFNIKAYFFIPANLILHNTTLWIDKILLWLSFVPTGNYSLANSVHHISDNMSRQKIAGKLWQLIHEDYSLKEKIINDMEKAYPFDRLPIDSFLMKLRFYGISNKQLELMKQYGHKIGCHSIYHDILSCLTEEELQNEMQQCGTYLGTLYNTSVYSYPFGGEGEVSKQVIHSLQKQKFICAFVNISKPHYPYNTFALPRFSLPNTSNIYELDAKLSGLEYFLKYKKLLPKIEKVTV